MVYKHMDPANPDFWNPTALGLREHLYVYVVFGPLLPLTTRAVFFWQVPAIDTLRNRNYREPAKNGWPR